MALSLLSHIEDLERLRGGRVVVLAAVNLDIDLLAPLYDLLVEAGPSDKLEVVIYCRGGEIRAAHRLALLLREFAQSLSFVVPHFCESAGTIMVLAGDEIVAGPAAIFSPIDPHLGSAGAQHGEAPSVISVQDVRLFPQMADEWFQLRGPDAARILLSTVCENIFPTALTAFYRSLLEVKAVSAELLSLAGHSPGAAEAVSEQLLFGHHSHAHAVSRTDLSRIGLPVRRDDAVDAIAWRIAGVLRATIGGNAREGLEDDWVDAAVVTRERAAMRRRSASGELARWTFEQIR